MEVPLPLHITTAPHFAPAPPAAPPPGWMAFPAPPPPLPPVEDYDDQQNKASMDAAAQIAETLHISEPVEEDSVFFAILRRLCLIADTDYVGSAVRKLASHAGGVPPIAGRLFGFNDTPYVADPGNVTYATIVRRLITRVGNDPRLPWWGFENLQKLNTEHKGDVMEAALAAANAAADKEEGKERIWTDLRGGACPKLDKVTPWIVDLVNWECRLWENVASSSAGGNPADLELADMEAQDIPARCTSPDSTEDEEIPIPPTDQDGEESDDSIFGLRRTLHNVDEDDELSDASSQCDDEMAVAGRERVNTWRANNFLLNHRDFSHVFEGFEEAYSHAGRAVAVSWSRARILAEPQAVTDMGKMDLIEATASKIRKVDELRKTSSVKRKRKANAPSLRQPGKVTAPSIEEEAKARFIEPLAQLMMDCGVGRSDNASATEEEILDYLRRKSTSLVGASDIPTLHTAITTADELREYLEVRPTRMEIGNLEPMVLEEFLCQSHAIARAVNASFWMCKNLRLGWPIEDFKMPHTDDASIAGTECKHTPSVQPIMFKALEDTMQSGAELGDPTWLALLATWLQAMTGLRLILLLRRSVPVELYVGWILFFCKKGNQRHNRSGFYWGVPSKTSARGYDWTKKFLEDYTRRRRSNFGNEMMGMIFRTDTGAYLSSKEVNALTADTVATYSSRHTAMDVTSFSWRKMLLTMADHLKFSPAERSALGEVMAKDIGDEATITLGYIEGREGKSRVCKLICAAALSNLARKDIYTFDGISAQQWDELAEEARTKVRPSSFGVEALWRNPDVANAEGGLKVKKSQMAFPRQLGGVPLAPTSRSGQRYCVDFQSGICEQEEPCRLGLHKCAAIYRGGRRCHGNHSGFDCRNFKRHAFREEADTEENPARRRMRMADPEDNEG